MALTSIGCLCDLTNHLASRRIDDIDGLVGGALDKLAVDVQAGIELGLAFEDAVGGKVVREGRHV